MNNVKQEVIIKKLNKNILKAEQKIYDIEKNIQLEKSALGSIIANNREAASLIVKSCKAISGVLFGLGLPYAFSGNWVSAMVAFGSSLLSYGFYAVGTRLDKHDIIWRKKCLNHIKELKNIAKQEKVKLFELYKQAEAIKDQGLILKDPVLEEEIKKDLLKQSYQLIHRDLFKKQKNQEKESLDK